MAYTVKKLSTLSGVTVRTLHFYEEEGLLKPAYYGSNGYRYYEEKELLQLQQILFFKELGFTIKQLKKVLGKSDFDQLSALYSHKKSLQQEWERIGTLLKTIDKTINHYQGIKNMNDQEIFDGFTISLVQKAKEDAPYFTAEEIVLSSVRNPLKNREDLKARGGKAYYQAIIDAVHPIFEQLARCIERGLKPSSYEVQGIIRKHHELSNQIHEATKEVYEAMALLYKEHPGYQKQLDPFHPDLAAFMSEGMQIFAIRELK